MLAKALYDNIADTTDEITFRRGDVVTVLDQDYQGLEGWWLCSLRGKKGIAPGNRLKLIGSYFDNAAAVYHTPAPSNPQWNRRSWHQQPNKVKVNFKVKIMNYKYNSKMLYSYIKLVPFLNPTSGRPHDDVSSGCLIIISCLLWV